MNIFRLITTPNVMTDAATSNGKISRVRKTDDTSAVTQLFPSPVLCDWRPSETEELQTRGLSQPLRAGQKPATHPVPRAARRPRQALQAGKGQPAARLPFGEGKLCSCCHLQQGLRMQPRGTCPADDRLSAHQAGWDCVLALRC